MGRNAETLQQLPDRQPLAIAHRHPANSVPENQLGLSPCDMFFIAVHSGRSLPTTTRISRTPVNAHAVSHRHELLYGIPT